MLVKKWMAKKPVTIGKDSGIQEAIDLMKQHSIRHLPVVDDGNLVGLVTQGDLREALIPSIIEDISLRHVMIANPITVSSDDTVGHAARLIFKHKIGGLPVVTKTNRLVGIITVTDILGVFIQMMGVLKSSSRVDVILAKAPDAFEEVSRIVTRHNGVIISVGIIPRRSGKRIHSFRLEKCDVARIAEALEKHGHKIVSVS